MLKLRQGALLRRHIIAVLTSQCVLLSWRGAIATSTGFTTCLPNIAQISSHSCALGVNPLANCGGVPSHRRRIGIRTKCGHTGGDGEWKYYADITNVPSIRVLTNSIAFADRYRAQDIVSQCLRKLMGGRPPSGAMGKTLPGLCTGRFMLL